jgi:hypothetical protein
MDTDSPIIDFDALTEKQRDLLGHIAMLGGSGHPRTIESLLKRGLIEEYSETLPGRFPVVIKRYTMPIWVHIQWCEWCSRHCAED